MNNRKICAKCSEENLLVDFHKHKNSIDGHRTVCKLCTNKQNAEYREANKELVRERRAKYAKNNKEKIKENNAKYRSANRELCIERTRASQLKNRDKILAYKRNYYQQNKIEIKRKAKEWREQFPEKNVIKEQRRRARKKDLVSNFTVEQWEYSLTYFQRTCAYCGGCEGTLHQEHFVPVSKGGGIYSEQHSPVVLYV